MKQITKTLFALLLCLGLYCLPTAMKAQSLLTGLEMYLRLDGNLNDVSGNGNHATTTGAWVADRNGIPNSAVGLTANSMQTIVMANNPSLQPQMPMTIAFDALYNDLGANAFANNFTPSIYSGMWVGVDANGQTHVNVGDGGTTDSDHRRSKTGSTAITTGTWHTFVCVIRNEVDMDIYLDCVNDSGSYSGIGGPIFYDGNVGQLGVASAFNAPGGATYMNGSIDRVAFWSRALSPAEVQSWCNGAMDTLIIGIENPVASSGFSLFPNPASQRITISRSADDQGIATITILDLQGRSLETVNMGANATVDLDVEGFAPGFYLARLEAEGQIPTTRKFQVK